MLFIWFIMSLLCSIAERWRKFFSTPTGERSKGVSEIILKGKTEPSGDEVVRDEFGLPSARVLKSGTIVFLSRLPPFYRRELANMERSFLGRVE